MQWARTLLNSLRPARRRLVGSDLEGNKYYESVREGRKARREAVTKLQHVEYKPGAIPVEWEAWIRGKREEAPTHEELRKKLNQAEVLQKRVQQVEERERDLRAKEQEEGLVARPAQESRPVGHASASFYEHMGNTQGPTSTGSTFQPGGWDPGEGASSNARASSADSDDPTQNNAQDTFQPEAWVPSGDAKK